jgi:pteridine reductase
MAGPIGLLVNSASTYEVGEGRKTRAEQQVRNLRLHALSPMILTCCLAAQKCAGAVINLLDARLGQADTKRVAYVRSKRMLYALTKMMAVEVAPQVRVNGIAPGAILPPAGGVSEACLRRMAKANLLGRMGKPDDIAGAVVYLAGARFVTGQVLYVDGGYREARPRNAERG